MTRDARVRGEPDLHVVGAERPGGVQLGHRGGQRRVRHGQVDQLGGHLRGEPLGRRRPQRGQLGGQQGHLRRQGRLLRGQRRDLVVSPFQLGQPRGGLLGPVEHAGDVTGDSAVGADQPAQRRAAFLDRGQPDRVGVERLDIRRELGGQVGDLVDGLGQPVRQPGEHRVVRADRLQRPPGRPEQRHRV